MGALIPSLIPSTDIVRDFYQYVVNEARYELIPELVHPEFVGHQRSGPCRWTKRA